MIFLRAVVIPLVIPIVVLTLIPLWIWLERRVCARLQQRLGPNRVGWQGLFQPIADVIKLLFKEDITPSHADRIVYLAAPVVALIPSVAALAVIPFGDTMSVPSHLFWGDPVPVPVQVADVNIGILWVLALGSLAVYGVVLAGWASNNKWSLLGGVRSAAQMVSYELPMGLAVIAVMLSSSAFATAHSGYAALSLRTAVESQRGVAFAGWNCFWHFPAFVIFCICAVAECNRAPFDLPEAEQELTGGFHTEYSSLRFAMFFMGEYIHMTTLSAVGTALFFGGYLSPLAGIPLVSSLNVSHIPVLNILAPVGWFLLKVLLCILLFIWLRWTLPRLRWDQLMRLGWVALLPAAFGWVMVAAILQTVAAEIAPHTAGDPLLVYRVLVFLTAALLGLIVYFKRAGRSAARPAGA
ncbi:MAG: NADH-quinone oxidoreductase subunit NuoH [Armatimonadetes bacterium]|nr:NADH-quinone oxidoreductase subunit NuoH [Armatimonadota bacterium]